MGISEGRKLAPAQLLQSAASAPLSWLDPLGILTPLAHAQLAWLIHPQKLAELFAHQANEQAALRWHAWRRMLGLRSPPVIAPHPDDRRFADPVWTQSAFWSQVMDWYLLHTHRIQDAVLRTPGLSEKERRRAAFWSRQWLNAVAPTNFLWTNPVALRKAVESNGESLQRGLRIFLDDLAAGTVRMTDPQDFRVGGNIATTPGAVVFRNRLLEVIHYTPVSARTREMPIVLVTPWINKFYVLDLTPDKSMVRYLLEQGYEVFITSWKNPGAEMRDTSFDDYLTQGVAEAVRVARAVSGAARVHAVGYCIGGTLLATYMAWLNRRLAPEEIPVAHWTLLASLVDFRAPGDIDVFIDEGSLDWLANTMAARGYLDGAQMANSFRLLRANPLVWDYVVQGYLYGEPPKRSEVMYWNMDATRMPYRMHEYYLREMYLHNNLVRKDAMRVAGEPIDLTRIAQPLYCVGAADDHIAPWEQVFRIAHHVAGPMRFVLSSSGHIFGIVNPPAGSAKRSYRVAQSNRHDAALPWREGTSERAGSWWQDWTDWLDPLCGPALDARPVATPEFPALAEAPGTYVLER